MRKFALYLILALVVLTITFVSAHSEEEIPRMDNSVFENPKRTPSIFGHEDHNEVAGIEECNTCHHIFENGKKIKDETSEDQECSECHKMESSEETLPLRKAFHMRCKNCHITKKAGPVMCGECHIK